MRSLYLSIFCAVVASGLSGCNSSSVPAPGGPNPKPPTQPAPPSALLAFEALAANPNTATITSATSGSSTVVISEGTTGDGTIQVAVGGTIYQLDGSVSSGIPIFMDNSTGASVSVTEVAKESDVSLARIRTGNGAADDPTGYSALGATTGAGDMGALIGVPGPIAQYTGRSYLVVTREPDLRDDAAGNLTLVVDFENAMFDGSMDLASPDDGRPNFEITTVNAMIENGQITGSSIVADVRVDQPGGANFLNGATQLGLDPATSIIGNLSGSFFGPDAKNVGGEFSFSGTNPPPFPGAATQKVEVQGGFIGTQ